MPMRWIAAASLVVVLSAGAALRWLGAPAEPPASGGLATPGRAPEGPRAPGGIALPPSDREFSAAPVPEEVDAASELPREFETTEPTWDRLGNPSRDLVRARLGVFLAGRRPDLVPSSGQLESAVEAMLHLFEVRREILALGPTGTDPRSEDLKALSLRITSELCEILEIEPTDRGLLELLSLEPRAPASR